MWEDATNVNGGKWVVPLPKNRKDILDEYWLQSVLTVIGENFDEGDEICGCVVSIRKQQDRLALWTKTADNKEACISIGKQIKAALNLPETPKISYQVHNDSLKRNSSFNNQARYEV